MATIPHFLTFAPLPSLNERNICILYTPRGNWLVVCVWMTPIRMGVERGGGGGTICMRHAQRRGIQNMCEKTWGSKRPNIPFKKKSSNMIKANIKRKKCNKDYFLSDFSPSVCQNTHSAFFDRWIDRPRKENPILIRTFGVFFLRMTQFVN